MTSAEGGGDYNESVAIVHPGNDAETHIMKYMYNRTVGLFRCIVNDLFFYNNQKSATSVFVIPTSVLVISCRSVSSIQKP